jgi:hypothetical protein
MCAPDAPRELRLAAPSPGPRLRALSHPPRPTTRVQAPCETCQHTTISDAGNHPGNSHHPRCPLLNDAPCPPFTSHDASITSRFGAPEPPPHRDTETQRDTETHTAPCPPANPSNTGAHKPLTESGSMPNTVLQSRKVSTRQSSLRLPGSRSSSRWRQTAADGAADSSREQDPQQAAAGPPPPKLAPPPPSPHETPAVCVPS